MNYILYLIYITKLYEIMFKSNSKNKFWIPHNYYKECRIFLQFWRIWYILYTTFKSWVISVIYFLSNNLYMNLYDELQTNFQCHFHIYPFRITFLPQIHFLIQRHEWNKFRQKSRKPKIQPKAKIKTNKAKKTIAKLRDNR